MNRSELINAQDCNDIKSRIKNELLRRQYSGSVSQYGQSSYDITVNKDEKILYEFYEKTVTLIKNVNPNSFVNYNDKKNSVITS